MKNNHDTDVFEDWDFEDDGEFTAVDPEAEGRLVRFAREYGWRAYAIPVLAVLTVFVICLLYTSDAADEVRRV